MNGVITFIVYSNFNRSLISLILVVLPLVLTAQEENDEMRLFFEEDGQVLRLKADNFKLYPISVKVNFELKGLQPTDDLPEIMVLPGEASDYELLAFSIPEGRSWGYKYAFSYYSGDASAKHNDDHVYLIPYKSGERYKLSQGYNGSFSHQNENSLDFTMPKGTEITAARAGRVVDLKEDSDRGCPSADCNDFGNFVRTLHSDGTMADYYHLQQNGALVELGQFVEAGDVIAEAGATGWASGVHLHFIVFKPTINGRMSIPTLFLTENNNGEYLKEDRSYLSVRH